MKFSSYVTIGCGFSNNKNYKRKIWDYKRADYLFMKQKISEINWVNLITGACDIHGAVSDFTSIFLKYCVTINNIYRVGDQNWIK
jgi:hypothetical protein